MKPNIAVLWRRLPSDIDTRIADCIQAGCKRANGKDAGYVFFRADDVAVPGRQFARMMALFAAYGAPLSLAVVPATLTRPRWQYLNGFEKMNPGRWCWHQHGWRHINHETKGKKQEFGAARKAAAVKRDLEQGKKRLERIMADRFCPVFTPPWNRCSRTTLVLLKELGYAAVSRSRGSKTPLPAGFPDYYVNVDLHTRKETSSAVAWKNLFAELQQAIASKYCGIMIHHRRMNEAAFDFLEMLLKKLAVSPGLRLVNFKDMTNRKTII